MTMTHAFISPLHQTVSTTPTDYWNDSCSLEELTYTIHHGAVGATTNPQIVMAVRTLRGFIGAYHDLLAIVRDFMLPDPE